MKLHLSLLALGLLVCAGCGDLGGKRRQASGSIGGTGLVGSDINSLASGPNQPATPAAQPAAPAAQLTGPAVPGAPAVAGQPATVPGNAQPGAPQPGGTLPGLPGVNLPGQPQPPQAQPGLVTEKAQAGATGKGNYGGPGAVTTPISVYFQAQERLIFLQVQQAIQLYEAEQGQKPKTEDEFMKQVIEANQIRLPQLPPGSKYKYDPQKGELLVERPE
ncbi:MAG TPA: hypothetical protein VG125_10035 [Pirellulales bacterium]|jgi:hypothetical protein|nr:hypothetical protein [Pirellulales bacterium]